MGTLSKNNHLWALIKTPDKKIHRISLGQYLGQNFGQVTQIENTQIKLIELIPNGVNSWKQRQTSIAIKRPTNLQSTL
jgi:type IV pilus assembly protein PilP